jgi:hypothetical protein
VSRRLAIAGLCLLSLVVCCGLAWWQWNRFESSSGTFQNLGYVLQWPLFGLFPAFMAYRIHKLRRAAEQADRAGDAEPAGEADRQSERVSRPAAEVPAPRMRVARAAEVVHDVVDDEEDEELAAYNRYLAELHARDQENREKGKPAW